MLQRIFKIKLFISLLLLTILLVACSPKPYTVVETYNITVPYNATEKYKEKVSYQVERCNRLEYNSDAGFIQVNEDTYKSWKVCTDFWMGQCIMALEPLYYSDQPAERIHDDEYEIYIKNNEERNGVFEIIVEYYDNPGNWLGKEEYDIINVSAKSTFIAYLNYSKLYQQMNSAKFFTLSLEKPIKEECYNDTESKYIDKERVITKYKEVERKRNITMYK